MLKNYYVYKKSNGAFAGHGTPFIDDEFYGCTEIKAPEYEDGVNFPYFDVDTQTWELVDIEVEE